MALPAAGNRAILYTFPGPQAAKGHMKNIGLAGPYTHPKAKNPKIPRRFFYGFGCGRAPSGYRLTSQPRPFTLTPVDPHKNPRLKIHGDGEGIGGKG